MPSSRGITRSSRTTSGVGRARPRRPPPRRRPPRRRPRCRPAGRGTCAAPGARPRGRRRCRTRITRGTSSRTVVPAPGARRRSLSVPPSARRALLHRRQARAARRAPPGPSGSKPHAVVGHRSARAAVAVASSRDVDPRRRRRGAARCRAPPARSAAPGAAARPRSRGTSRDAQLDRAARTRAAARRRACAARVASPSASSDAGPQLEDQRAQLLHRLARELAAARSSSRRAPRRVALEQRRRRLGRERDAEQPLRDRVVQLAREPVALLDDAQLAAALVQARVLDRDRGVRGEQLDQLLVVVGERRRRRPCRSGRTRRSPRRARRSARRGTSASPGARAATSRGSAGRRVMSSVR